MLDRCHGCAFTEGTEANRTDHTRLLSEACVMAREPFFCHEDGRVCRGYAEAIQGPPEPVWKQQMASRIAEAMNAAIKAVKQGPPLSDEAQEALLQYVFDVGDEEEC